MQLISTVSSDHGVVGVGDDGDLLLENQQSAAVADATNGGGGACFVMSSRKFLSLVLASIGLLFLFQSQGVSNTLRSSVNISKTAATFVSVTKEQEQQQVDSDKRPYFILHVGLQKTGTTFLQYSLCADMVKQILLQDNYIYFGMCDRGGGQAAKQQQQRQHDDDDATRAVLGGKSPLFFSARETYDKLPQLVPGLINQILDAKEAGRGLILSDENISLCKTLLLYIESSRNRNQIM
jgi:hypothetical protein